MFSFCIRSKKPVEKSISLFSSPRPAEISLRPDLSLLFIRKDGMVCMIAFEKITAPLKFNIALWGPSGAGKSYTALALAHRLGTKIAVADTEHQATGFYTARFPALVAKVEPPFPPEVFLDILDSAERQGFDVLVFDSLSPEWDGAGGCLALKEEMERKGQKGVRAWKTITPRHEALLQRINQSPLSIITTLREKPRVALELGESGKTQVRDAAPRPVMRERYEFEYDLVLHITMDHRVTATKSRLLQLPEGRTIKADHQLLNAVQAAKTGSGG